MKKIITLSIILSSAFANGIEKDIFAAAHRANDPNMDKTIKENIRARVATEINKANANAEKLESKFGLKIPRSKTIKNGIEVYLFQVEVDLVGNSFTLSYRSEIQQDGRHYIVSEVRKLPNLNKNSEAVNN